MALSRAGSSHHKAKACAQPVFIEAADQRGSVPARSMKAHWTCKAWCTNCLLSSGSKILAGVAWDACVNSPEGLLTAIPRQPQSHPNESAWPVSAETDRLQLPKVRYASRFWWPVSFLAPTWVLVAARQAGLVSHPRSSAASIQELQVLWSLGLGLDSECLKIRGRDVNAKSMSADLTGMLQHPLTPSQVKNVTVCLPNQVEGDEDTYCVGLILTSGSGRVKSSAVCLEFQEKARRGDLSDSDSNSATTPPPTTPREPKGHVTCECLVDLLMLVRYDSDDQRHAPVCWMPR